jgi:hypothetical protein
MIAALGWLLFVTMLVLTLWYIEMPWKRKD